MKKLRPFLMPLACFVAAWAITLAVMTQRAPLQPASQSTVDAPAPTKRIRDGNRRISPEKLAEDFAAHPMSEWVGLWERFAKEATAGDLGKMPLLPATGRTHLGVVGRDLLQSLGQEELAVRTGTPAKLVPGAYAALAERDPEAAWRAMSSQNWSDLAVGALRVLAAHDPEETLQRFRAMPPPGLNPNYSQDAAEGRRAAVWHTPLGSIFGAWARRDPQAALDATLKLPPAERMQAINEVAMTWSFRNGPEAVRKILDTVSSDDAVTSRHLRMDVMLRASFRTDPVATCALMAETPRLRKLIGTAPCAYVAYPLWAEADPAAVTAWLLESRSDTEEFPNRLYTAMQCGPRAAAAIMRGLDDVGIPVDPRFVRSIYAKEPELAESLAADLNIDLAGDPEFEELRIELDPADACDRWLAALAAHPNDALASLGWTPDLACAVAARAAKVLPDKAAALAKLVPASALDATNLWRRNNQEIARYWPELAGSLEYPATPSSGPPPFPEARFKYDPASCAETMLNQDLTAEDVSKAVQLWAPTDPAAARAWVARLPAGPARQRGELALVGIEATNDPLAALTYLTRIGTRDPEVRRPWQTSVNRLIATGGDWQSWFAKMPAEFRDERTNSEVLASQAQLLQRLSRRQ